MKSMTKKELAVMRVLWSEGALKPADIQDRLPGDVGNAALRSLLVVLLEKGHVKRTKQGKAYFYKATTAQRGVFRRMVDQLSEVFCEGSRGQLVANLVSQEKLSREDLDALEKILAEKKQQLK